MTRIRISIILMNDCHHCTTLNIMLHDVQSQASIFTRLGSSVHNVSRMVLPKRPGTVLVKVGRVELPKRPAMVLVKVGRMEPPKRPTMVLVKVG